MRRDTDNGSINAKQYPRGWKPYSFDPSNNCVFGEIYRHISRAFGIITSTGYYYNFAFLWIKRRSFSEFRLWGVCHSQDEPRFALSCFFPIVFRCSVLIYVKRRWNIKGEGYDFDTRYKNINVSENLVLLGKLDLTQADSGSVVDLKGLMIVCQTLKAK